MQVQLQVANDHLMRASGPFVYFDVQMLHMDMGVSVTIIAWKMPPCA